MVDDMGGTGSVAMGPSIPLPTLINWQSRACVTKQPGAPPFAPLPVSLLTGQYPYNHGWIQHYDVPRWGGAGLRTDRFTTFARHLRDAGYATAIGGKWQINHLGKQPDIPSNMASMNTAFGLAKPINPKLKNAFDGSRPTANVPESPRAGYHQPVPH